MKNIQDMHTNVKNDDWIEKMFHKYNRKQYLKEMARMKRD